MATAIGLDLLQVGYTKAASDIGNRSHVFEREAARRICRFGMVEIREFCPDWAGCPTKVDG
jgi:hypothetical protein